MVDFLLFYILLALIANQQDIDEDYYDYEENLL